MSSAGANELRGQTEVLLVDRQQLEAEPPVQVLQRSDGTQSEILEQNQVVLLQRNTQTVSERWSPGGRDQDHLVVTVGPRQNLEELRPIRTPLKDSCVVLDLKRDVTKIKVRSLIPCVTSCRGACCP